MTFFISDVYNLYVHAIAAICRHTYNVHCLALSLTYGKNGNSELFMGEKLISKAASLSDNNISGRCTYALYKRKGHISPVFFMRPHCQIFPLTYLPSFLWLLVDLLGDTPTYFVLASNPSENDLFSAKKNLCCEKFFCSWQVIFSEGKLLDWKPYCLNKCRGNEINTKDS